MTSVQYGYAVYTITSQSPETESSDANDDELIPIEGVHDTKISPNYRLSLLSSSLQAENETNLRSFLVKKLERPSFVEENVNIASLPSNVVFNGSGMIYFYLLQNSTDESVEPEPQLSPTKRFLICFPVEIDTGLDLFSTELFAFCHSLGPHLQLYNESVDISEHLRVLGSWYETSIMYISRVVSSLNDHLALLMYASYTGMVVECQGLSAEFENDINKFIKCCSLSELLQDGRIPLTSIENDNAANKCQISVGKEEGTYSMSSTCDVTPFCIEAAAMILKMSTNNPFKLRQVVDTFKLKVIQDMNAFKRLTKLAENDHYALFRAYRFLVSCGNGSVLLYNAKLQTDLDIAMDVLNAIEEHISDEGGYETCHKNNSKSVMSLTRDQ